MIGEVLGILGSLIKWHFYISYIRLEILYKLPLIPKLPTYVQDNKIERMDGLWIV